MANPSHPRGPYSWADGGAGSAADHKHPLEDILANQFGHTARPVATSTSAVLTEESADGTLLVVHGSGLSGATVYNDVVLDGEVLSESPDGVTIEFTATSVTDETVKIHYRYGAPPLSGTYTETALNVPPFTFSLVVPVPETGYTLVEAYAEDSLGRLSASMTVTISEGGGGIDLPIPWSYLDELTIPEYAKRWAKVNEVGVNTHGHTVAPIHALAGTSFTGTAADGTILLMYGPGTEIAGGGTVDWVDIVNRPTYFPADLTNVSGLLPWAKLDNVPVMAERWPRVDEILDNSYGHNVAPVVAQTSLTAPASANGTVLLLYGVGTEITSGGGETDHGLLTGLSDDDHLQYHTDARGDLRYYTQAQVDSMVVGFATETWVTNNFAPLAGNATQTWVTNNFAPLAGNATQTWVDANYADLAHQTANNNPHFVTATQVGLGSVQNYGIATTAEATGGTSNTKYMTPLRVQEAINNNGGITSVTSQNDGVYASTSSGIVTLSFDWTDGHSAYDGRYINAAGDAMTGPLSVIDGGETTPGLKFKDDPNTGLYRSAIDGLSITAGGIQVAKFKAGIVTVYGNISASGTIDGDFVLGAGSVDWQSLDPATIPAQADTWPTWDQVSSKPTGITTTQTWVDADNYEHTVTLDDGVITGWTKFALPA